MGTRWNAFFAEEGETWHLSAFRILWAPFHADFAMMLLFWSSLERTLPPLPYPGLALMAKLPFAAFTAFACVHILGSLLLLLGWRTRVLQILLALNAAILFFHSASTYQNHYAFFLLVSLAMTLMPSERFYSLDARREQKRNPATFLHWQQSPCSLFAQKLILLQAGFLYAFAALNKLSPAWFQRWSGTAEMLDLMEDSFAAPLWAFLLARDIAWIPLLLLIIAMFSLSIGIFFGRRYPLIIFTGALMHLTFDLHLRIMQFTPMMLSVLFLALFPTASPRLQRVLAACIRLPASRGTP